MDLQSVCRDVMDDVDGTLGCVLTDLETGLPLAAEYRAGTVMNANTISLVSHVGIDLFRGKLVRNFERSLSRNRRGSGGFVREVQLTTTNTYQFMSSVPGWEQVVFILVTNKNVSLGMGLLAVHDAVRRLSETPRRGYAPATNPTFRPREDASEPSTPPRSQALEQRRAESQHGGTFDPPEQREATADDLRSCLPDADLRQRYRQDWSSLLHAMVANGTPTPVIRVFLSAGGDASAEADGGATPLHVAAGRGRNQVVELLLEYGANVDARDDEGMTPLHHAAAMAHNETIAELLEGGANPDVCGTKGDTPLIFAVVRENPGAVRLLLRDGDPEMLCDSDDVPPLHAAVIGGNLDVVNALLEAGAYANVCSDFLSPLDISMSPELASALVAAGGFAGSCL